MENVNIKEVKKVYVYQRDYYLKFRSDLFTSFFQCILGLLNYLQVIEK